jgi:hypothetical protein
VPRGADITFLGQLLGADLVGERDEIGVEDLLVSGVSRRTFGHRPDRESFWSRKDEEGITR